MVLRRLSRSAALALVMVPAVARAGEIGDDFGRVIAADGERVAIAAPLSNYRWFDGGAVDIYHLREGTWRFEQRVTPSEPQFAAEFGSALALGGDLLAVARIDDYGAEQAWVFGRGPDGWAELAVLRPPADAEDYDFAAVAVDDGWVAVGTPYVMRAGAPEPGEIHLFQRTGDGMAPRQVLVGTPGARRQLGQSFEMARGVLVAPTREGFETWVRAGSTWTLEGVLPPAGPDDPLFDYAFDGATLLALERPGGVMRIYSRKDGGWSAAQTIEAFSDVNFSQETALFGDWAAISIWLSQEPDDDSDPQRVRLLHREAGTWKVAGTIAHESPDYFGMSPALTDQWLWVGELADEPEGFSEALAFRRDGADWSLQAAVTAVEVAETESGCAVTDGGPLALAGLLLARRRRRTR
ncbi:hypothetical protein [Nannocystis punicea]|uniref:MYXO-CTERM domain-containing protein n=1 Tax=Nannocystis punicea TaxID=2995304 RepID=A0ABY7GTV8_9BACT|nr:hypothetical protein [Nannocystis poenicansa]WAS90338.1 hypothetical protein O0S08_29465 [Nannocystis poenicansa]